MLFSSKSGHTTRLEVDQHENEKSWRERCWRRETVRRQRMVATWVGGQSLLLSVPPRRRSGGRLEVRKEIMPWMCTANCRSESGGSLKLFGCLPMTFGRAEKDSPQNPLDTSFFSDGLQKSFAPINFEIRRTEKRGKRTLREGTNTHDVK